MPRHGMSRGRLGGDAVRRGQPRHRGQAHRRARHLLNADCGGSAGQVCTAEAGSAPETVGVTMYHAAIVLEDDTDPVFTSTPSGSLMGGGVLSGTQAVSFSAGDVG